jgi:hypothetical protein
VFEPCHAHSLYARLSYLSSRSLLVITPSGGIAMES